MSNEYEAPLKITIPTPSYIPLARGVNSTSKYGGNLRVRCSNAEYDLIKDEAERLGITLASFCRWSITRVARALKQHRENGSDNIEGQYAGQEKRKRRTCKG